MAKDDEDDIESEEELEEAVAASAKRGVGGWLGFAMITGVAFMMATPTMILLSVGMLPTIVTSMIDGTREKLRSQTMGALNMAGCLPFAVRLWVGDNTVEEALFILRDVFVWGSMYGSAAAGAILLWIGPFITAPLVEMSNRHKLNILKKNNDKLTEEYGQNIVEEAEKYEAGFIAQARRQSGN